MTGWMPVELREARQRGAKQPELSLSKSLLASLNLALGGLCTVAAGGESCQATLKGLDTDRDNTALASPELMASLCLTGSSKLGLAIDETGAVRFGPVIAVLADTRNIPRPFGEQTSFLQSLMRAAQGGGCIAYVLTPTDALRTPTVGYRATPSGGWTRARVPYPDVCYDRCLAMTHNDQSKLSKAKATLTRRGTIVFNAKVGSKERVDELLRSNPDIAPYLPETRIASKAAIEDMLKRYRTVYVKPSWGTQGRSVVRVSRGRAGYTATSARGGRIIRVRARSAAAIASRLQTTEARRTLVQQGIDLVTLGSRLADIRVLVQKTGKGDWEVTGQAARVGQEGSPVSNLHQGGGVCTCADLLTAAFHSRQRARVAEETIGRVALNVASALDRPGAALGELGIDIGVDKKGRVWFIEANPRPGRSVFKMLAAPGIRARSVARPMEYAAHLAVMKHTRKEQQDVEGTYGSD